MAPPLGALNHVNDYGQLVSTSTMRQLLLSTNRVEVKPPILENRTAHRQQLPISRNPCSLRTLPLRHPVVEPGHRSIIPEMHQGGLHHCPPQPPGALLGYTAVAGDLPAAVGAGNDPRVASQVVAAPETGYVPHLGLH